MAKTTKADLQHDILALVAMQAPVRPEVIVAQLAEPGVEPRSARGKTSVYKAVNSLLAEGRLLYSEEPDLESYLVVAGMAPRPDFQRYNPEYIGTSDLSPKLARLLSIRKMQFAYHRYGRNALTDQDIDLLFDTLARYDTALASVPRGSGSDHPVYLLRLDVDKRLSELNLERDDKEIPMTNNVTTTVEGNLLTITVDLSKDYGPSSSGKTTIVASSQGNAAIEGKPGLFLGLNVFKK